MKIYKVGGCIRDELLGLSPSDIDYEVTGSSPDEMLSLGFKFVGNEFPVFIHPTTNEEYALARTEKKTDSGYNGFSFDFNPNITLEESLKRRDLTINAMAMDEDNNLIDYFNGKEDLKNGILRHVSEAFREDPVRILRTCRFSAKFDFEIHESTMDLMREMVNNREVNHLTSERVFKELEKLFKPGVKNIRSFFDNLDECGALEIIFPEVYNLIGVPQTPKYHNEVDTYEHVMICMESSIKMEDDSDVIFAVLTHDFGKGITDKAILPKHTLHEIKGVPLVEEFCNRLKVSSSWKELALKSCEHHTRFHKLSEMKANKVVKLLYELDGFRRPWIVNKLLRVSYNDVSGKCSDNQEEHIQENLDNARFLLRCLNECSEADFSDIVSKYSGKIIGEKIREERIKLIKRIKQ